MVWDDVRTAQPIRPLDRARGVRPWMTQANELAKVGVSSAMALSESDKLRTVELIETI